MFLICHNTTFFFDGLLFCGIHFANLHTNQAHAWPDRSNDCGQAQWLPMLLHLNKSINLLPQRSGARELTMYWFCSDFATIPHSSLATASSGSSQLPPPHLAAPPCSSSCSTSPPRFTSPSSSPGDYTFCPKNPGFLRFSENISGNLKNFQIS
jgi:hypothetical protein